MHQGRSHTRPFYTNDQNRMPNYQGAFNEFTNWKHGQPIKTSIPFMLYLLNSMQMKIMQSYAIKSIDNKAQEMQTNRC